MKKYSIIHVPVLSFFSGALYRDVGLLWKGTGFAYLLLLLAVCWIPAMIQIHTGFSNFITNDAPLVINQVPEITITNGEVSIEEPQPYYIKAPDSNQVLAIIDTTGTITSLEDESTMCLVTRTEVITRKSDVQTQTFDLSEVEDFVLDGDLIMGWLRTAGKFAVVIIYPFALFGSYVYRIIQALIYAAVGLLFAKLCNTTLSYTTLLRLAVVAVTPAIIISTVVGIAEVNLPPYALLFYLVVALGYLFFGVKACSEQPETQQDMQFPQPTGI
ncbi:MAG: DUF1189 domain-containing protein [Planctomycetota bacterium]|jgi:hypothetical protein